MTDRENCPMRHENGNCIPCGGFCTAVNDEICQALHNAYNHGYYNGYYTGTMVRKPQKPLTAEEIQDIIDDVYWIEFDGSKKPISASHWYLWSGFIGSYAYVSGYCAPWALEKADYGKAWRCWAEKPTDAEREAAEWEK